MASDVGRGVADSAALHVGADHRQVRGSLAAAVRRRDQEGARVTMLVPIALVGWIGVVFALFSLAAARGAVAGACVLGVLLLPMAGYKVMGLPAYDKTSATVLGVVIAAA